MEEIIEIQRLQFAHSVEAAKIDALKLAVLHDQDGNMQKALDYRRIAQQLSATATIARM